MVRVSVLITLRLSLLYFGDFYITGKRLSNTVCDAAMKNSRPGEIYALECSSYKYQGFVCGRVYRLPEAMSLFSIVHDSCSRTSPIALPSILVA